MNKRPSLAESILFPGIAMMMGWGLRGYIGGGPYAAMIPGALVALCISLQYGYSVSFTALVALFGAIGVGYGGNMTYGQTLGFIRDVDTLGWGLLGTSVKGGIWGLLGGVVLGLGLAHQRFDKPTVIKALVIMVIAHYIGWKLINDPKLIYFSNLEDKPRTESWSGLLSSATALLIFLRLKGGKEAAALPLRFAFWGLIGGAVGFGVGSFFMFIGPKIPIPQEYIGWWKVMEFFFGFCFGAALGIAAYRNAEAMTPAEDTVWLQEKEKESVWPDIIVIVGIIALMFFLLPLLFSPVYKMLSGEEGFAARAGKDALGMLGSFTLWGSIMIAIGLVSLRFAWQMGISITICHSILDLTGEIRDTEELAVPSALLYGIALLLITATAFDTYWIRRRKKNIQQQFFLNLCWSCILLSFGMSLLKSKLLFPDANAIAEKGSWLSYQLSSLGALPFVQGTFTLSALYITWVVYKRYWNKESSP